MSMSNYPNNSNPFFTDDDDDFGFSKPRSGASRDGEDWDDVPEFGQQPSRPLTRDEQIQQMKENSQNRQLEGTQRALSSMYESERMGIATAEELVQQGEQLDNVERKLDMIDGDLKTSQKHINNIKSVFGGIKNWWVGKKDAKAEAEGKASGQANSAKLQTALERDRAENEGSQHPAMRLRSEDMQGFYTDDTDDFGSSSGATGSSCTTATSSSYSSRQRAADPATKPSGYEQQLDTNIDMMSSGMSRLKDLALGLGDEIGRQNDQVGRITDKTDNQDLNVRDKNKQMRGILGK